MKDFSVSNKQKKKAKCLQVFNRSLMFTGHNRVDSYIEIEVKTVGKAYNH